MSNYYIILISSLICTALSQSYDGYENIPDPIRCMNFANRYFVADRIDDGAVSMNECIQLCNDNQDCYVSIYNGDNQCVQNMFCAYDNISHVNGEKTWRGWAKNRFPDIGDPQNRSNTVATHIGKYCNDSYVEFYDSTSVERVQVCHDICRGAEYECKGFTVTSDGLNPPSFKCTIHGTCNVLLDDPLSIAYTFTDSVPPTSKPTLSPTQSPTKSPTNDSLTPPSTNANDNTEFIAAILGVVSMPFLLTFLYYMYINKIYTPRDNIYNIIDVF